MKLVITEGGSSGFFVLHVNVTKKRKRKRLSAVTAGGILHAFTDTNPLSVLPSYLDVLGAIA
jgi:hypothetical protein